MCLVNEAAMCVCVCISVCSVCDKIQERVRFFHSERAVSAYHVVSSAAQLQDRRTVGRDWRIGWNALHYSERRGGEGEERVQ